MDHVDRLFQDLRQGLRLCGRCRETWIPQGVRRCRPCHAAYMREYRASHSPTPEQRRKDIARSKAGVYYRRGKITRRDCPCGSTETEMHHPDYDRPYDVEWLCREHHLEVHRVR